MADDPLQVRAIEGHDTIGVTADAQEAFLRHYEPELVQAARKRMARELLGLPHHAPQPSPAALAPHAPRLDSLALVDVIGYDLWATSRTISGRYTALPNGDKPALIEILLGDAQRGAGLAPLAAIQGTRQPANCFLSWHMAAPLLKLLEAQRAQEEKDDGDEPIFIWNNLFVLRQVRAPGTAHNFNFSFDVAIEACGRTLAFVDPWHAPTMLTRIWCLAEIYHTDRHGCRLDVAMCDAQWPAFERALLDDFESIQLALSRIDVRKAEGRPEDVPQIMAMVEAGGGAMRLNKLVLECMRSWAAGAGRAALAALPAADRPVSGLINGVAELLMLQGRLGEAQPLLEEALAGRRAVLGAGDPRMLTTIYNCGRLLRAQGRVGDALPLCKEAVAGRRAALGSQHVDTLSSINNLGMLLKAHGRLEEARPLLEEALASRRAVLGDSHPQTLGSIGNFGSLLQAEGRLREAQASLEETLAGRRRVLGNMHPNTLVSATNLGTLLHGQGLLAAARPLLEEACEGLSAALGDAHPWTLGASGNLGLLLRDEGQLDLALPLIESAVAGSHAARASDRHPDAQRLVRGLEVLRLRQRCDTAAGEREQSTEDPDPDADK
jgi:tetratricopeptide (TPR) repeat protein